MELEIGNRIGNWKWSSNKEMGNKLSCQHSYDVIGRKSGSSHTITAGLIKLYDFVQLSISYDRTNSKLTVC